MLNADTTEIRLAGAKVREGATFRRLKAELPGRLRDDHIVKAVAMPPCFCSRRKSPFRDAYARIIDLYVWNCLSSLLHRYHFFSILSWERLVEPVRLSQSNARVEEMTQVLFRQHDGFLAVG